MNYYNSVRLENYLKNSSEFNVDDKSQSYRYRCPENPRHSYYFCQDDKCVYCVECDSDYNIIDCVRVNLFAKTSKKIALEHMPDGFKDLAVLPEQLPLYKTIHPYVLNVFFVLWCCLSVFFVGAVIYAKTNNVDFNPFLNSISFCNVNFSAFNLFSLCLVLISVFMKKCFSTNRVYRTIWYISLGVFVVSIIVSIVMGYK